MGLHEELARSALARGQWIAAITHMALARGFGRVWATCAHDGRNDVEFTFERHQWSARTGPTKIRLEGRHLAGSLTGDYVAELLRMMEQRAPPEWPARAHWIALLMPMYRALPAPPVPKQLPAAPSWACPSWDGLPFPPTDHLAATGTELTRLSALFGLEPRAPAPRAGFVLGVQGLPMIRQILHDIAAEVDRARRASELDAAEVTIAGLHRDLAGCLLEAGHSRLAVARTLRRAGVSAEGVIRVFDELEDDEDPIEERDELEVRVLELHEQGRR